MNKIIKKSLITAVLLGSVGATVYAYYTHQRSEAEPTISTAVVTKGDIVDTVSATGTLEAVTTVQVGSQVSGTILELHADYNSLVHKGQVIARLDPSLFNTEIEQARANLNRAQADVERLQVALDDARTKLSRAQDLSDRQLIPKSDLDTADVTVRSAEAQVRSSQAQVTQARAALNQNEVSLQHTIIQSPIDGIVISRNVDVGQTVAASMQAPTLFVLAADLEKMRVLASLDESDVGRIRPGQDVTFRVDAYPTETFNGAVSQIRLQPQMVQNVVTYSTVIDVQNGDLKLKPGMTANVTIEIARRTDVVRVPNTALRFRPTDDVFAALGQTPPESTGRSGAAATGSRAPTVGGSAVNSAREASGAATEVKTDVAVRAARATTVDALFGPLPAVASVGRVWLADNHQLKSVRVRLGVTDGQTTELLEGPLQPGAQVVTNVATLSVSTRPAAANTNVFPLMQQPGRGGFAGGGRFSGGR